ncbi:MAG: sensor histidine kinase, partial [Bacteroidota bacterium]
IGKAYSLGNIGMVYANLGQVDLAEKNMNQAIEILEETGDFYPVCFYLLSMADIFWEREDIIEALAYAKKSLKLGTQYNLKQQISDANQKLSELYEALGNSTKSLRHYKDYVAYRDSVTNLETIQKIADQRTEFEVGLKESEIETLEKDKQLQQTYVIIAIILGILFFTAMLYFRLRLRTSKLLIQAERKESNGRIKDLLKNHETETLRAMINGKEEERKHLAKELHNHLGSLLATVKVNLNGLKSPNEEKQQTIISLVDQACQDVRNISHELNMGVSENFGLVPALEELVRHLKKVNGLAVEFSASIDNVYINAKNEILLYRITQELISNVLKHANATELFISLTGFEENNMVNILVEDNGDGFAPEEQGQESKGIGLESLNEIVQKLDGELSIDSHEGLGTTISIDLPLTLPETIIT